jgi:hypothetical protein
MSLSLWHTRSMWYAERPQGKHGQLKVSLKSSSSNLIKVIARGVQPVFKVP